MSGSVECFPSKHKVLGSHMALCMCVCGSQQGLAQVIPCLFWPLVRQSQALGGWAGKGVELVTMILLLGNQMGLGLEEAPLPSLKMLS